VRKEKRKKREERRKKGGRVLWRRVMGLIVGLGFGMNSS
jgi:hypothetical protein